MKRIPLYTPREVMVAFLSGAKLINRHYGDMILDESYLYMDKDSGFICEEDGAGAKKHRADHFTWRDGDPGWMMLVDDLPDAATKVWDKVHETASHVPHYLKKPLGQAFTTEGDQP